MSREQITANLSIDAHKERRGGGKRDSNFDRDWTHDEICTFERNINR